jgi:GTPase SAR1 family protein
MYYRGAAAAIVVFDITKASSFITLKHWVEELKTKGPKDIAIAIAGNKTDLDHLRVGFKYNSSACCFHPEKSCCSPFNSI